MVTPCEDLATKAELEELKSQINKLLGKTENGEFIEVLDNEDLEGTSLGESIKLAFSAIQDFGIGTESGGIVSANTATATAAVAAGTLKYVKVAGSNVIKILPKATESGKVVALKVVKNAKVAKAGVVGAQAAAASLAVLASLVNIIGNLGLNIATVNTLGFRIDQNEKALLLLNQDFTRQMNLLAKTNQKLNDAQQELNKAQEIIDEQGQKIESLNKDVKTQIENIVTLENNLKSANQTIIQLKNQNAELSQQIQDLEIEATEEIENLQSQLDIAQQNFEIAQQNTEQMLEVAKSLGQQLADLEGRMDIMFDQLKKISAIQSLNVAEINQLKVEIAENKTIAESKLNNVNAKLVLLEDQIAKGNISAGGLPVSAQENIASSQTATLELANVLAGNPLTSSSIQINPSQVAGTNPFTNLFNQIFPQITPQTDIMTNPQVDQLQQNISDDIAAQLSALGLVGVTEQLTTIQSQTTPEAIRTNVEDGICNSTNPGGCLNSRVMNPLNNLRDSFNNNAASVSAYLSGVNSTLNGIILNSLNTVNANVLANNAILAHATYGLQATRTFLGTAWRATRMDKVLNYLSFAMTLHNAAMLSRNIGASIGDAISAIANNSIDFIKNEEGSKIDINDAIGNTLEGFLKATLGVENYNNTKDTFAKYNRIVNAASNVIWSIQSVQAGLAQGLQTVGNYTGRIGNALIRSGAVLENSYQWMNENLTFKTGRIGQIQAVLDNAQTVGNVASEISSATAEFREAQQQVNGIGDQFKKIEDELIVKEEETLNQEATKKSNSQGAQPTQTDLTPDPKP